MAKYLDLITTSNSTSEQERAFGQENGRDETNEITSVECSRCGGPFLLPETRTIGCCVRCLTEAEWIDTLARMALRRERTHRAVADRKAALRAEGAA